MNNNWPSLDVIYELTKGNYQMVTQWADSLDNKVVGLFGLSTVVIGVVTAFTATSIAWDVRIIPLCIAITAFVVSSCFALKSYQSREFMLGYNPGVLLEDYASLQPEETRYLIMKYDGQNWEHNRQLLNNKADALRWAIVATGVEVTASVIWLLVR
jgi:hypothetical protein